MRSFRYFDELKSLLPPMQDTKFDKNSILVNSITLIKALRTELAAAQTLRCTGAIGDPSQCQRILEPCDLSSSARVCLPRVFCVGHMPQVTSITKRSRARACARPSRGLTAVYGRPTSPSALFWATSKRVLCLDMRILISSRTSYSSLDISHLTILSITARDDIDESRRQSGLLLSGGGQKECSYRAKLVRKDGSTMVCSIELVVLEVEGQPYCFMFTAHPPNMSQ
jgi:hypothetical protein